MTTAYTDPLDDGLPIVVTEHALDQQRERCAIQKSVWEIRQEVAAAFFNGRYSSTKPPWCKGVRNSEGGCLYMWDEEKSRAYVVLEDEDGQKLVVVTLLIANPDSPFAALLKFMTATGLRGPT
jgi:hypothetical protein